MPSNEKHLVEMLVHDATRREVDGQLTYQYRKLERALALVPADRRRRCVDIGAHVGLWSMQLVKHFQFVLAFEPNPVVADLWRWNVTAKNALLRQVALGKGEASVGLKVYDGHSGHTQVVGEGDVQMRTLDSFGFTDVDFIKIDVEGLEASVVKGAEETLLRCRPIMVVEQKGEDARMGLKRDGALGWLQGLGMQSVDCIGGDYFLVWP
ncbi:MAG TPA: FkbM family methyltransferase [Steroidobacteraceae bacterium]|nr:FkbM family methyltransferase [Steroidobacteraceae bacterium]